MAAGRPFRVTPVFLAALGLAACVAQPASSPRAGGGASVAGPSQPRTARYSCADGDTLTIENRGSSIRVMGPDGTVEEELPASPPNQTSRFGAEHDAVVIDGRDALIMKAGRRPLTCKR